MVSAPWNSPAIGTQTLSSHHVCGHYLCAVWIEGSLQINRNITLPAVFLLICIETALVLWYSSATQHKRHLQNQD